MVGNGAKEPKKLVLYKRCDYFRREYQQETIALLKGWLVAELG